MTERKNKLKNRTDEPIVGRRVMETIPSRTLTQTPTQTPTPTPTQASP